MKLEKAPIATSTELAEGLLIRNAQLDELIEIINDQYYYWDKVKYMQMPEGISSKIVWTLAKFSRARTPYKVRFGNYHFSWSLPAKLQEQLHLFDMNIGGSLESKSLIPDDEKNRYLVSSIMEEAIASSQIEGAVTTRKLAKEMLRKNKSPKNKSEQMIYNNYKTIRKILDLKNTELSRESLLAIHGLITYNTLEDRNEEGAFRINNDVNVVDVVDGDIVHEPPLTDELEALMDGIYKFFNHDGPKMFIHPIIKAIILHFMIGYIHPFADGNGRTARALFYWYLLRKGYWLTEYLSISRLILKTKEQYAKAYVYTETDDNDLTYFLQYNLKTMSLAYDELRAYIQRKLTEKKQVSAFIKMDGINDRQALILKWFYEEPSLMLTIKEVETRLAVSNETARNDLKEMTNMGYLVLIKINGKKQAFVKSDNFDDVVGEKMMSI